MVIRAQKSAEQIQESRLASPGGWNGYNTSRLVHYHERAIGVNHDIFVDGGQTTRGPAVGIDCYLTALSQRETPVETEFAINIDLPRSEELAGLVL
jgi:hypothetical protein